MTVGLASLQEVGHSSLSKKIIYVTKTKDFYVDILRVFSSFHGKFYLARDALFCLEAHLSMVTDIIFSGETSPLGLGLPIT
jgi:hypothetical protein